VGEDRLGGLWGERGRFGPGGCQQPIRFAKAVQRRRTRGAPRHVPRDIGVLVVRKLSVRERLQHLSHPPLVDHFPAS
jgi:hypothetical protein